MSSQSNPKIFISIVSRLLLGLSVFIPSIHVDAQSQIKLPVNFQEPNWEKQLETGLIALEANCDVTSVPFNREKVVRNTKMFIFM